MKEPKTLYRCWKTEEDLIKEKIETLRKFFPKEMISKITLYYSSKGLIYFVKVITFDVFNYRRAQAYIEVNTLIQVEENVQWKVVLRNRYLYNFLKFFHLN